MFPNFARSPFRGLARNLALAVLALSIAATPTLASQVTVDAALDHSVLPAGQKDTHYLKVALTGFTPKRQVRAAMNIAIVIDKSSSMSGEKIEQAKAAAIAAVAQLRSDDIVSIVAYDSTVTVLVPATKVSDRRAIHRGIQKLRAGGMTALFAGTAMGAAEVRKFYDTKRVNRVILLSDGQANVGPSTPGELGRLGASLRDEGITVTTVGLGGGYNEDLMVALADNSGGQHAYAQNASDLEELFRQGFGALASIVAKEVTVQVTFAEGFRPTKSLGMDSDVVGQRLTAQFAQLYAGRTDELLIAFDTPNALSVGSVSVASIKVTYHNMISQGADRVERSLSARVSDDAAKVRASENSSVMVSVVAQTANNQSALAVRLRDEGKTAEAEQILEDNSVYLKKNFAVYKAESLKDLEVSNDEDKLNLAPAKWNVQRKRMKERQQTVKTRGSTYKGKDAKAF